jgi:hypothetical protein
MKRVITHRALLARINRKLKAESEKGQFKQVRRSRKDGNDYATLGLYYIVDFNRNAVTSREIDLEQYGRDQGCLEAYEVLEREEK